MKYSDCHRWFSCRLYFAYDIETSDVLENPEKYLGPNYKEVLNFWFYWEKVDESREEIYWDNFYKIGENDKGCDMARELAKEVIGPIYEQHLTVDECELVAAHLYIERGIPFTFIPLLFDL